MNTKFMMTASAVFFGIMGIAFSFFPQEILSQLGIALDELMTLCLQVLGAMYLGFAMLNWMTKSSIIGGVYNKPIAMANFIHFVVAGLALIKGATAILELPMIIWVIAAVYGIFAVTFGLVMFRHPLKEKTSKA